MDLELIGEGRLAEVFAWEHGKALKLYRSPERNDNALAEAAATMAVFAAGVPAPRCYGTVEMEGRVGLILDRLPGPTFGEVVMSEGVDSMAALADLHTRIHGHLESEFTSLVEQLARRIANAAPPSVVEPVLARLANLPDGDNVLHSDLHVYNAMVGPGGDLVAIDWDRALRGPTHYGVARSHFLLLEADVGEMAWTPGFDDFRKALAARYLDEYAARHPLDRDELAAWRLPVLAARLDEPIAAERAYLLTEIARELGPHRLYRLPNASTGPSSDEGLSGGAA